MKHRETKKFLTWDDINVDPTKRRRVLGSWLIEASDYDKAKEKLDAVTDSERYNKVEYTHVYLLFCRPGFYYGVLVDPYSGKEGFFKKIGYKIRILLATATGNYNSWFPISAI